MAEHKQVAVGGIEVDEGMERVLSALWGHRVQTFNSCIANDSKAHLARFREPVTWIEADANDWQRLLTWALNQCPELLDFLQQEADAEFLFDDDGWPEGDEGDEYWHTGNHLIFSVSLRFPRAQLDYFTELLEVAPGVSRLAA
jgi:hypothetical protein